MKTEMKKTSYNGRFGAMAAVARRQYCANLHVTIPQEVQWKPPLRQAAGTLPAMAERQCVETVFRVPRTDTQKLVGEAEKVEAKFKIHLSLK